jgi:hypothetical protein
LLVPTVLITALSIAVTPVEAASRFLTGIAAQGAATNSNADVLTSSDLKTALDLEAQKQLASCGENSSCMAEIASALDADIVVTGTLLAIGEGLTLQLAAYDAKKAASAGRRVLRAPTIDGFPTELEATTRGFIEPLIAGRTAQKKLRVLVLDFDATPAETVLDLPARKVEPKPNNPGWLSMVGGGTAGIGLLSSAAGGILLFLADGANAGISGDPRPSLKDQRDLAKQRDAVLYPGIAALGGGVLLAGIGSAIFIYSGVAE